MDARLEPFDTKMQKSLNNLEDINLTIPQGKVTAIVGAAPGVPIRMCSTSCG